MRPGKDRGGINTEWRPSVKELAEAVTAQCRSSNRVFLAALSVASLVLLMQSQATAARRLPLLGIHVDDVVFFPASFAILTLTTIAFVATHLQAHRVLSLAHVEIDRSDDPKVKDETRRYLDCFTVGAWSRVAPVDQVLHDLGVISSGKLRLWVYVALKLVYWAAALVLPVIALLSCAIGVRGCLLNAIAWPLFLLDASLLGALACLEIRWVRDRWRRVLAGTELVGR